MKGVVFDIQHYALYDGPGIRTAIYLKGCPLKCYWCHNPESQHCDPQPSYEPDGSVKTIGKMMSVEELVKIALLDRPFYEKSGGGVSITGGEPTFQSDFLLELLKELKKEDIHTVIETCGQFPSKLLEGLTQYVDIFLFDLKQIENTRHLTGTGVKNDLILNNFKEIYRIVGPKRIIVRVPLIPGFNTDNLSQNQLKDFLNLVHYEGDIHYLPYHDFGIDKYDKIKRDRPPKIEKLTKSELEVFKKNGILFGA